ncbi:MAG: hypothetical protein COS68_07665 [Elusimicrobia bacterium CG06_land_8_20_14_3_00_38_11]|nr:MAG: hypothetical protein COS68_07665 [Elusimicrobia bacterium CG06_land_8_20_14_3_00_38_11]
MNNTGIASVDDVLKLIKKIQKKVKGIFSETLELGIKVMG